jgi:DNA-binding response OmpR family regulator
MYKYLKEKTVLYIEDEKAIRDNVTELISEHFAHFHTASSAEEGYQIFQNESINIIITDIEMASMSGLDLLEKIRETDNKIHLVVMSAHTKIEYLLEAIPFKLEQYVVKPLTSKKVRELLTTLNLAFSSVNLVELTPNLMLNKESSLLYFNQKEESLTKKERDFLAILADKKSISYDEIDRLWGNEVPSQNAVRSMIKKLRRKLPAKILKTRTGFGYYIE